MGRIFPNALAAGESRLQGIGRLINFAVFKAGKDINALKRTPAGVTPVI
jgi:hypothetical protein